jgi:hypothetical protein
MSAGRSRERFTGGKGGAAGGGSGRWGGGVGGAGLAGGGVDRAGFIGRIAGASCLDAA